MALEAGRSFARYLEAKQTVDDRALNVRLWDRLAREVADLPRSGPLRVLEIGGGIGTMVERLRYSGMLGRCHYTLLDSDPDLIDAAQIRLTSSRDVQIEFVTADAFTFLSTEARRRTWQVVIASAVLDLTDLSASVPRLLGAVEPGGLLYAPINYDGMTTFVPAFDDDLDATIERLYDEAMRIPQPDGTVPAGSRSGRMLIPAVREAGAKILDTGAADWIVYADETGYHADEAYFLQHILGFIEEALTGHPELDHQLLSEWISTRKRQIATGDLIYIAHQIDVLARRPGARHNGRPRSVDTLDDTDLFT